MSIHLCKIDSCNCILTCRIFFRVHLMSFNCCMCQPVYHYCLLGDFQPILANTQAKYVVLYGLLDLELSTMNQMFIIIIWWQIGTVFALLSCQQQLLVGLRIEHLLTWIRLVIPIQKIFLRVSCSASTPRSLQPVPTSTTTLPTVWCNQVSRTKTPSYTAMNFMKKILLAKIDVMTKKSTHKSSHYLYKMSYKFFPCFSHVGA